MKKEIKSIPILTNEVADEFISNLKLKNKEKGTIDFSLQVEKANNILIKSKKHGN
jgi:2-methylcitrate dehydratase PrpD